MKRVSTNDNVTSSKLQNLLMTLKEGAVKKVLLTSAAVALSAGIFFGGSASAFASTEFPVGDLREVQEIKEIEVEVDENSEEAEGNLLQPQALGATLTTGRHYQYLSADEKLLYAALYSAVMDKKYVPYSMRNSRSNSYLSSKLYPVYAGTTSLVNLYPSKNAFWYAVYRAAEACYYDHPNKIELYLVGATYCATYKASNGQTVTAIVYVAYGDDTKFASMDSQIDSRANSIVSAIKAKGATSAWPAYNEYIAHNYYSSIYSLQYDNNAYESGNASKNAANQYNLAHSAYGSLVLGKAVCDGYSTGFEIILEKLGIPTMCVSGMAGSASSNGGHCWNMVNLDGNWYEVDTTWADTAQYGKVLPNFFNQTTTAYSNGIMNNFHRRVSTNNLVGFRFPEAKGTHWSWNYIRGGRYAHDTYVYALGITAPATQQVQIGSVYAFGAQVQPANATNKAFTLTSSNPGVIAVSGNVVRAVGYGSAVVTARSVDGGYTAACTITVASPVGSVMSYGGANYRVTGNNTVAFAGGTSTPTVTIADKITVGGKTFNVTAIADNALKGNTTVKTVKGGKNVKKIGKSAFSGCKSLKSVKLSSAKITSIGAEAFSKSGKLSTIEINGNNLKKIGKNAFKGIKKKASIKIKVSKKSKYKKVAKLVKKAGAKKAKIKKK